jgi:two-component system chemotaxis sensor kinase CheA
LSDGVAEITYGFKEKVDSTQVDRDLSPVEDRPYVAGVALVEGQPVDVVDCHALFARYGRIVRQGELPLCRLPGNDRWFQDFLRPLVEAAGYRVVDEDDEVEADLAIASHSKGSAGEQKAGRVIWLRSLREEPPDRADTIYRYDREGLIGALRAANAGRGQ